MKYKISQYLLILYGLTEPSDSISYSLNFYIVIPASAEMPGTDSAFHIPTGGWDSGTLLFCPLRG